MGIYFGGRRRKEEGRYIFFRGNVIPVSPCFRDIRDEFVMQVALRLHAVSYFNECATMLLTAGDVLLRRVSKQKRETCCDKRKKKYSSTNTAPLYGEEHLYKEVNHTVRSRRLRVNTL